MSLINAFQGNNGFDPRLVTKLRRNYRALPCILNFYNKQFYDSQLISTLCGESSPEAIKLRDLRKVMFKNTEDENQNPFGIIFVNVDGKINIVEFFPVFKN